MSKLKKLPYSRVFSHQKSARIYLGEDSESWNLCARESTLGFTDLLLLPAAADPFLFQWPVKNLDVLVFDTNDSVDMSKIEKILLACLNAGANLVIALTKDHMLEARP